MTDPHPSRFILVRALSGELDAAQQERLRTHLDSCSACARVHVELEAIQLAGQREAPPLRLPQRKPRLRWLLPSASLATAALVAVLATMVSRHEEIRSKGGTLASFACKDGARIWHCKNGERVRAGTAIALQLKLDSPRFVMLLGRDATQQWRIYFPVNSDSAVQVPVGVENPLPGSLVLDALPGEERFVLVMADTPFSRADLLPFDPQRWAQKRQTFELVLVK